MFAHVTVVNKRGLIHLLSRRYVPPMESLGVHIGLAEPMGDKRPSGPDVGDQEYPRTAQMSLNSSLYLWCHCSFLHIIS